MGVAGHTGTVTDKGLLGCLPWCLQHLASPSAGHQGSSCTCLLKLFKEELCNPGKRPYDLIFIRRTLELMKHQSQKLWPFKIVLRSFFSSVFITLPSHHRQHQNAGQHVYSGEETPRAVDYLLFPTVCSLLGCVTSQSPPFHPHSLHSVSYRKLRETFYLELRKKPVSCDAKTLLPP